MPISRSFYRNSGTRIYAHQTVITLLLFAVANLFAGFVEAQDKPNILWLSCEDISPHLGCYGYPNATTPNLDEFAKEGVLYERAYTTAGVCAPCRSAIITGMYQTSIGTQHMRCEALLPDHVKPFTYWMKQAGYYCTNNSKQDYQFKTPRDAWNESSGKAHWKQRPDKSQPFFSVFNFTGCHESGIENTKKYKDVVGKGKVHDRGVVAASLPPYYPDTPETRDDWGRYYDVITAMDTWVAEHLKELDNAGLAENTIVVFWSDHGVGLPRAKRWLYESGTHVPLIVRVPAMWQKLAGPDAQPGTRSTRLVSMIDLGPTMLSLAGVTSPDHMQGHAFLGPHAKQARQYVFGARDRMDERYDIIRMVRDQRFRYVRNYEPYKTWYQYMNTPEKGRTMLEIRKAAKGSPSHEVAQFLLPHKPLEELYDVETDPHELNNLAGNPAYSEKLDELRQQHLQWVVDTRDLGLIPEAELHRQRATLGSEWAILNTGDDATARMELIRDVAVIAGGVEAGSVGVNGNDRDDGNGNGESRYGNSERLIAWLRHPDPAVRYWAATGIGNRNASSTLASATADLEVLLKDESENVRIAAARALSVLGKSELALEAFSDALDNGTQWARVHAAIVLDEMDEAARPAIEAMKRNNVNRKEFVADGKYAVRVLNKALNDLQGTANTVP